MNVNENYTYIYPTYVYQKPYTHRTFFLMSLNHINAHGTHLGFFNGMKEHGGGHYDLGKLNLTNK
jgi:hypothetical protein